jgi:hypothetical protein
MSRLSRNLKLFLRSERVLAEMQVGLVSRKAVLLGGAMVAGLLALAMANVAGFFALAPSLGSPGAASVVALVDAVAAGLLAVVAVSLQPGREEDVVREVRDMALDEIGAELEVVQQRLAQVGDNVERVGTSVARFVQDPLELLLPHLVVPTVNAITSIAKSRKKKSDDNG